MLSLFKPRQWPFIFLFIEIFAKMFFLSLLILQGFLTKEINSFHAIDDVNRQLSRPRASLETF